MDIVSMVTAAYAKGWGELFNVFEKNRQSLSGEQQAVFIDSFFLECLKQLDESVPTMEILALAIKWQVNRNLSIQGHHMTEEEEKRVYACISLLRTQLDRSMAGTFCQDVLVEEALARSVITLWRDLFLSSFSVLHQRKIEESPDTSLLRVGTDQADDPCLLLRLSLYYPFGADRFWVNVEKILISDLAPCFKVILAMWLVNIPRYNATQQHRQKLLDYFPVIERISRKVPNWMDPFFHPLTEYCMVSLFRIAYCHDDNSQITCRFGDFVASQMQRFFPQFAEYRPVRGHAWQYDRKIRVGYVSTRFVANAVTFYMANRILQHDRNTFEIYVFAIGTRHDEMTELLARNSNQLIHLDNPLDYRQNAQTILSHELDILLFADIGMEIPSYLLAGLRLAPMQGALLGHAAPTGLPTMDCFFSSEVEPPQAQGQYREKLIRLPNVGAAQVGPSALKAGRSDKFSRRQLGIPDDAFVFISCANGMKHVPERDFIWTEILRLISHAYILIKPFSPWDYDREMVERIKQAARLAGAPDRIRYIGGCDSHNEVFSLLALADAQLDTYPFNGWTTTIEAFCLALPTVTQEGNGYRSRLGAGFLRAMGIKEGIAQDETGYIQWAVRFATEPTLCNWIRNRIKANREHLLFNNRALQMEYEKALIELVRK